MESGLRNVPASVERTKSNKDYGRSGSVFVGEYFCERSRLEGLRTGPRIGGLLFVPTNGAERKRSRKEREQKDGRGGNEERDGTMRAR